MEMRCERSFSSCFWKGGEAGRRRGNANLELLGEELELSSLLFGDLLLNESNEIVLLRLGRPGVVLNLRLLDKRSELSHRGGPDGGSQGEEVLRR